MSTLADQLANLSTPTPDFGDPEQFDDVTSAKLTEKFPEENDKDNDWSAPVGKSIRRKTVGFLSDTDRKYVGKKTSRKQLLDDDGGGESTSDEGGSESNEDEMEINEGSDESAELEGALNSDEEDEMEQDSESEEESHVREKPTSGQGFSFSAGGDFAQYGDDSEEEEEEEGEEDEDEEEEGEEEEIDEGGVKKFSRKDANEEIKKGNATKRQLAMHESLLEMRIKLQKVLSDVNQMPQPSDWNKFVEEGGKPYVKAVKQGQKAVHHLLENLIDLQTACLGQSTHTAYIVKSSKRKSEDEDDESIPSDEEEDEEEETPKSSEESVPQMNMKECEQILSKRHNLFKRFRNETIQKWYDKTRVASGKLSKGFSAFDQSALKQIEQILADRNRLILRTQLKRSAYHILGKPVQAEENETESQEPEDDDAIIEGRLPNKKERQKDYNEEIFDDSDFYHHLLREFIQSKTVDKNDPLAMVLHNSEIRRLRNKAKKMNDSKTSKERKIKYDIHPKLMNFMAPNDLSSWTDEAKDELYKSLFGKAQTILETGR